MPPDVYLKDFLPSDLKTRFENLLIYCERHRRELYEEFNQCPWFVDHGLDHVKGVLSNLDGILLPILKRFPNFLSDRELFYLLCAVLFHDIGMCYREKIDDKYSERSIEIRKRHGLYSAEMILKDDKLPLDYDERRIIAEIVKYHQSKAPLTENQLKKLGNESLLSEPISETLGEEYEPIRLRLLAALLRLADACDINYRRARKELYDRKLEDNRRKILEIKENFVAIVKAILENNNIIKRLEEETDPDEILKLCNEILEKLKSDNKRYKYLYNLLKKLAARVEILNIQKEHYIKHQAIANVYFIRGYIVLEPSEFNKDNVKKAKIEIEKELSTVKEIFKDFPEIPDFKVIVKGDKTWKKEQLRIEDDERLIYRKERYFIPIESIPLEPIINTIDFFNRENEISQCLRALNEGLVVFIYGIPGVGKTYLAVEIAKRLDPTTNNVFMYTLKDWTTLENVLLSIGKFLNLRYKGLLNSIIGADVKQLSIYLIKLLNDTETILIFDDIHMIKDERLVEFFLELIRRSNNFKLIFASRRLHDFIYKVIDKIYLIELKGFDEHTTKKFLEKKCNNPLNFERIYHLTDGHPLSLNLIVSLSRIFPPHILYKVLETKLKEILIKEIYNSLNSNEKYILTTISVFDEPVDIDAIPMNDGALEALESLIEKNLIIVTKDWRYSLHPLIKSFVYNSLGTEERIKLHKIALEYYKNKGSFIESLRHAIILNGTCPLNIGTTSDDCNKA